MSDAMSDAPLPGVAKLLQESRFIVPSHQRDYSWTEDDVKQIFDDIEYAMEKTPDAYFLGLLVFLAGKPNLTILDGQQRLAKLAVALDSERQIGLGRGDFL